MLRVILPHAYGPTMGEAVILSGDAGGTNVRFALAHVGRHSVELSDVWKRAGADYPTFNDALRAYLAEVKPKLAGASFGLAGQNEDGRVELLNRGWTVDIASVTSLLGLESVLVTNDFWAMARAAPELSGDDLHLISEGESDPEGSLAIGGPGTGFGVAVMRRYSGNRAKGWVVIGGEGGHQGYAPQTKIEWALAEALRAKLGYVSNEIVAAGVGFEDTLEALFHVMGMPPRKLSQAEVIEAAKAGDPLASEFCRIRAAAVMAAMGNLALVCNATGGVFIAGGVSQRLEPWLKEEPAVARFRERGLRTGLMAPIPIRLITSESAPLIGSAKLWLDEQERGWL
ncbi:MAG: glucokinase [Hyphomonadaceae bacterium]|nr:glucokinase [Hyphomonadaceae bacterium]